MTTSMDECTAAEGWPTMHDLVALGRPLVLRGLVDAWPAVAWSRQSSTEFAKGLAGLDSGAEVDALVMAPEEDGCVGYNADLSGFNYDHYRVSVTEGLRRLAHEARQPAQAWRSRARRSPPACRHSLKPTRCRCSIRPSRRGCGSATGSPRRRISTSSTTSPA